MNIYEAIKKGDLHKFRIALEKGANVNVMMNGLTPLHLAVKYNRIEIVKELIAAGVEDKTPLIELYGKLKLKNTLETQHNNHENKKLLNKLDVDIPKLKHPALLRIAKAIEALIKGGRTKNQIIREFKISKTEVLDAYKSTYEQKGMNGVEQKHLTSIGKKRNSTTLELDQALSDRLKEEIPQLGEINSMQMNALNALLSHLNSEQSLANLTKKIKIPGGILPKLLRDYRGGGMEKLKKSEEFENLSNLQNQNLNKMTKVQQPAKKYKKRGPNEEGRGKKRNISIEEGKAKKSGAKKRKTGG